MSCCSPINNQFPVRTFNSIKNLSKKYVGKMCKIPRGVWKIGSENSETYINDYEGPVRFVKKNEFQIDETCVSNTEFNEFVYDTGYITEAEKVGWSFVFYAQVHPSAINNTRNLGSGVPSWWTFVKGAFWGAPDGPGSHWKDKANHPVVHVSWNDAKMYANWAGKRLPSEEEWEIAASGGLQDTKYPWGNELTPNKKHKCNIWQGHFPYLNTKEDGFLTTAPVKSFEPNNFGLYNVIGNVWEWCDGKWSKYDKIKKPMRGGSYLCHKSYCNRYRISARTSNTADSSSSHLGFRCASN